MAKNPIVFAIIRTAQSDPAPVTPDESAKAETADNPPDNPPSPSAPSVVQSSIKGEPGTGYEGPEKGAFNCWNCEYASEFGTICGQDDMKRLSTRPKLDDGRVLVSPFGCCEYVARTGKYDSYYDLMNGSDDYDEKND